MGQAARAGSLEKTAQVETTTQRYFSTDSMLNHSTCNESFFLFATVHRRGQPRRSARWSPGSASGFGRVAQVRADVRACVRKQFSQRIFRISLSSGQSQLQVSSQRLWLDGPATDPGFDFLNLIAYLGSKAGRSKESLDFFVVIVCNARKC